MPWPPRPTWCRGSTAGGRPVRRLSGERVSPRRAGRLEGRARQVERGRRFDRLGGGRQDLGRLGARAPGRLRVVARAQALLDGGHPAAAAAPPLRAAATTATGHAPLLAEVRAMAGPRVDLREPSASRSRSGVGHDQGAGRSRADRPRAVGAAPAGPRPDQRADRRRAVHASTKTASVHVSSIFRKLGVIAGRAQAAAVAEQGRPAGQPCMLQRLRGPKKPGRPWRSAQAILGTARPPAQARLAAGDGRGTGGSRRLKDLKSGS